MSDNIIENRWLQIPAEDYEGHMSSPEVMQSQALAKVFGDVIKLLNPKSVMILGCTTGNGFEHLVGRNLERVVGIDINEQYLNKCRTIFEKQIPSLELFCADINNLELESSTFDLVHAALIFEYVDSSRLLKKISEWLYPGGILSVVIQIESKTIPEVTPTSFQSLQKLSSIINLVDSELLTSECNAFGFIEQRRELIDLPGGKQFLSLILQK